MNDIVSKKTFGPGALQEHEDDVIDLASYLDLLIENRWLIIAVAFAVTVLGAGYAFLAEPVYEANLLVQVEDSANSSSNILGDLAGAFDLKSAATAEMEILRSRFIVARAVDNAQLCLDIEPKYFPLIGRWISKRNKGVSNPGVFGWGGYVWGSERIKLNLFEIPAAYDGEEFEVEITGPGTYRLIQSLAQLEITGRIGETVKKVTSAGTFQINVSNLVGRQGARFTLVRWPRLDKIEDLQKSLLINEKGKQSGIIGVSLEGTDPNRTADILNEIGHEYIRQNVERKSAEAEKSLAFLEQQLPLMKINLEQAETKYNALRNRRGTIDLGEEAKAVLQESVLSQTNLVQLKQKRDELLVRYQPTNPLVQSVEQQIRTLNAEIESVNKRIKGMPAIEQDVLRLTRDVKVNTDLYTALLNSSQQLRLVKASKVGNARLLDHAVAPLRPVRPKRLLVVISSMFVGLLAGVLCAFARRSLYGAIEEPHEIEQALGLVVSAAIPFSEKQVQLYSQVQARAKKVSVLASEDSRDMAIESLRSFRTSLQFSMLSAKNNIVMVTGPTPGVGKSFISVNLAAIVASTGKKVLLIDGDIRKGYLNNYFGIERPRGLSELIVGEVDIEDGTYHDVTENVDFISTGVLPPNPAELLGHPKFGQLLELFARQYDLVIIDTAPVLAVADAMIVAPHVGAIFNVVRSDVSTLGEIEESVKRLKNVGSTVAGIVFNGLKPKAGRYGYGSKYGKYRYAQYKY